MEIHVKIIGVLLIILAFVHLIFPKYFNWKEELERLSLINKEIMQIHTLFIALTVLLMGLLCVSSAAELSTTILGKRISLGFGIFWGIRLLIQFWGYSAVLWKGKFFETIVHVVFIIFWIYLTTIFLATYFLS